MKNIIVINLCVFFTFFSINLSANPAATGVVKKIVKPSKPKVKPKYHKKTKAKSYKKSMGVEHFRKNKRQTTEKRRRINKVEKTLISSRNPKKTRFKGRTVVKRDIVPCSRSNIALMLHGKAPIGADGKRINLHHLKQQKNGTLVELTHSEHNNYSRDLHRHTRTSEITDRNSDFMKFRREYWKSRAVGCISRGK